ncbi:alpha-1A adrenergic receptor-like [Hydractinia symbiolongicarpus]|uniref:alpha-1A adrenergic receptor-like n=1 Tax=Hydractinia symbiolongicarpus TaxID=13093 RepID=UPI00254F71F9|nr:alpha-1A adrenergic receptor-like [Hydractinia symbiolongicarpus]
MLHASVPHNTSTLLPTSSLLTNNFTTTQNSAYTSEYPFGHTLSKNFAIFIAFCFLVIIVTSVICNTVLIFIIVSVKKLHSVTHVFIINLAVSDLITVLGTIPFDVEIMIKGYFPHGKIACGIMYTTFFTSLPSSVLNLTLLTAEKYIKIKYPFYSIVYLTNQKVIFAVLTTWCYTLFVALFPTYYNPSAIRVYHGLCYLTHPYFYDIFQLIVNFLLPILFICYANIGMFLISKRQIQRIRTSSTPLGSFVGDTDEENNDVKIKKSRFIDLAGDFKAAKRTALLVGVFLFCWLSYIILVTTNILCDVCHSRELTWMGNVVNYSASAINPLLYGLSSKAVRKEILEKFRKVLGRYSEKVEEPRVRLNTLIVRLSNLRDEPVS